MAADLSGEQTWVWLARIRKVQGRKGEVLAEVLTDFPEKFTERKRLWLLSSPGQPGETAREAELISHWMHKGGNAGPTSNIVLHFAGVNSISEAEALRGLVVAIPRAERAPLDDDGVYVGDLIGCSLVEVSSNAERNLGIIEDVDRDAGPVALLVVQPASANEELLIPFAKAYLRKIDLEAKRVEMALPEGLIEVQMP
jgi:16S rRNA processing protein RimM